MFISVEFWYQVRMFTFRTFRWRTCTRDLLRWLNSETNSLSWCEQMRCSQHVGWRVGCNLFLNFIITVVTVISFASWNASATRWQCVSWPFVSTNNADRIFVNLCFCWRTRRQRLSRLLAYASAFVDHVDRIFFKLCVCVGERAGNASVGCWPPRPHPLITLTVFLA